MPAPACFACHHGFRFFARISRRGGIPGRFSKLQRWKSSSYTIPLVFYRPFNKEERPYEFFFKVFFNDIPPQAKYIISNLEALVNILNKGTCLALGNLYMIEGKLPENIIAIPIRDNITCTIDLLVKKVELEQPLIKAFVDFYTNQKI